MANKIAYLILTSGNKKQYGSLLNDLAKLASVKDNLFVLFDSDAEHAKPQDKRFIAFEKNTLATLNTPFFRGGNIGFGNTHIPLLYFARLYPDYDYYWIIEDDVRFSGSFDKFLEEINSYSADFVSAKIKAFSEIKDFFMWDWVSKGNKPIDNNIKIWSFNPIYRISLAAVKQIHESYIDGWSGHFELLLPTVMQYYGLSLMDFGGVGAYTPEELVNKYYNQGNLALQTHRYRPPHLLQLQSNKIYHPVKPMTKTMQIYLRMVQLKWQAINTNLKRQ